ncbi:TRAP transporter large permease subunit [Kinneretia asaccharophila]|uniref:Tripartite ATP-independent transporter DctM subunit n=1 Tax=Roseateles asaccharophilus TaxID=582607 RepID=A0A4R6N4B3_9BURK|nr:TRAP transporter large permease subunit [Roseateles asaccharophilus]MDN3544506.1 TRAP transporter large permease subunit [Roseateles asaccharophilus]TDP09728.1 tripartite ATP-independent transporter DctM subunit [Roseateles asaccharophilus]
MTALIAENFVPLLFVGLFVFLLLGIPVAFGLAATGLLFGFIGIEVGLFPANMFGALPLRVFGIMSNDTLLAIPFFTLMGIILERSGMAEDLLETVGQVFGPLRGGLAIAVILVGALLAATTGVVAAAVISMGLISLPIMLRYGYNRTIATGAITASGTLAQAIPPSLVLIVLADQLGRSVGDMYAGALLPGLLLVGTYLLFIVAVAFIKPSWVPALPPEARIYRESSGASGHKSLLLLLLIAGAAGWLWSTVHDSMLKKVMERPNAAPGDEIFIMSMTVASFLALGLALMNKALRLGLLSKLAERVTFVLIPPLVLIFLVLGTIFLGVATPTEGGAMGAVGALLMALLRGRMSLKTLNQALDSTARLSCFVLFILIGSTVFSFTFNAADGHFWVESLFKSLPGGALGFLIVVNILIFVLGMFIDFFEIAFIVIPMIAPVAEKLLPELLPGVPTDAVMIWFGVIVAMNLQTSFLTPPFGFALFYLRSVAPKKDYKDRVTTKTIPAVTTAQIYKGSIAFIILQVIMVSVIIAKPELVIGGLTKTEKLDDAAVLEQLQGLGGRDERQDETPSPDGAASDPLAPAPAASEAFDPMAGLLEAVKKDGSAEKK